MAPIQSGPTCFYLGHSLTHIFPLSFEGSTTTTNMQPEFFTHPAEALTDLPSGVTIIVGGQNGAGFPTGLLQALTQRNLGEFTLVCEADSPEVQVLYSAGQVRKLLCPPLNEESWAAIEAAGIEVEPLPAGLLAERIRSAGAGIGSLLITPNSGEAPDAGKDRQELDGQHYVVETPLWADFALLKAHKADTLGNLIYQGASRNWNTIMATAASVVVVEVDEVVEPGVLDPEAVITPGIFVDRIVCRKLMPG